MSHYFDTPANDTPRRTISATIWGHDLQFVTAGGVFSGARLDQATSLLLQQPPPTGSAILDMGCGWGPIAVAVARATSAHVTAIDINELALRLCRENAAAAGVADRVSCVAPDQVPPEQRFDEIWSNPPIRIGKPALHALLLTWLPRLQPTGRALLVVGKNLGADSLQTWLGAAGYACTRLTTKKTYRILEVCPLS